MLIGVKGHIQDGDINMLKLMQSWKKSISILIILIQNAKLEKNQNSINHFVGLHSLYLYSFINPLNCPEPMPQNIINCNSQMKIN